MLSCISIVKFSTDNDEAMLYKRSRRSTDLGCFKLTKILLARSESSSFKPHSLSTVHRHSPAINNGSLDDPGVLLYSSSSMSKSYWFDKSRIFDILSIRGFLSSIV